MCWACEPCRRSRDLGEYRFIRDCAADDVDFDERVVVKPVQVVVPGVSAQSPYRRHSCRWGSRMFEHVVSLSSCIDSTDVVIRGAQDQRR